MEMNESRVYRQTISTTTLTRTTQQSPSLEKVRLNGNGEQITLSLPITVTPTPTPACLLPLFLLPTSLSRRFALCHQSVDDFQRCQLARNFVVANGLRLGRGVVPVQRQLCRLSVIKIYAWTAAWLLPYAINCHSGLIIYVWQRSQINARLIFL